MSRVRLVTGEQAPLTTRSYFAKGDPGSLVASLAQVPELLEVALPFVGRTLGAGGLPARTKELVILRTSALQACRFCVQTHTVVALDCGLDRAEVEALRDTSAAATGAFSEEAERALLDWTDAVAVGPGEVDPALAERLREHFEDAEIVELTLLVGATLMLNRYCTALALPTSPAKIQRLIEEGLL